MMMTMTMTMTENNEEKSVKGLDDTTTLQEKNRNKKNDDEMILRAISQIIALRREVKELRLEGTSYYEINQQSHSIHRKNIRTLMQNPTINLFGGRRKHVRTTW